MVFGPKDEITYTKKEQKAIWQWLKALDNYHRNMNKVLTSIYKRLQQLESSIQRLTALERTIIAMKQKDMEFASRFNQIASLMSTAAKTKTETVEAKVKT